MEIRKADAKGRMTGFTPGTYYVLQHNSNGSITVYPQPWALPVGFDGPAKEPS